MLLAIVGVARRERRRSGSWTSPPTRPTIDTLKPTESGANSEVYAADGTSLGYVQSDDPRTPVDLDEIPKTSQQATVAIEDEHFYEHAGVDYGAIVRAAVENVEAGEVKQGGVDDHPAAGPQPLHRGSRGHDRAQDQRGEAGARVRGRAHEDRDPRAVPEHRLLRHQRRPHRGRRRGRLPGLLQQGRLRPQPRRVGAARRAPAGAVRLQPVPQPRRRRSSAATRCSTRWPTRATSAWPTARAGEGRRARPRARLPLRVATAALLLRLRPAGADRQVRRQHRRARAGSRSTRRSTRSLQEVAEQAIAAHPVDPARPTALVSTDVDTGDIIAMASSAVLRRQPVQPRRPGPPPAGLLVQALRADDGGRPGGRSRQHLLPGPEPITLIP